MYGNRTSIYWPRIPYDTTATHSFGNECKSNSQPIMLLSCVSQPVSRPARHMLCSAPAHALFLFVLAYLVRLRAANNCRWLYTMSDINGIIPYSGCVCFSFLHFGMSHCFRLRFIYNNRLQIHFEFTISSSSMANA